jgi:hypothetical protein
MAITKAQRDKAVATKGSGTFPFTPESLRQQMLAKAGISEDEQAKMVKDVWRGIKDGLRADDVHVSVVGNEVETTIVPNHSARAKARDQALDIVGIRAPRSNSTVSTRIRVNVTMPEWAKPAESQANPAPIDVTPRSVS